MPRSWMAFKLKAIRAFRQSLLAPWAQDTDVFSIAALPIELSILSFVDETQYHPGDPVTIPGHTPQGGIEVGIDQHFLEILFRLGDIAPMVAESFVGGIEDWPVVLGKDRTHFEARRQGQIGDIFQIGTYHIIFICG